MKILLNQHLSLVVALLKQIKMHYSYCLGLQRRYYNRNHPHLRKNDWGYGGTNQNEYVFLKISEDYKWFKHLYFHNDYYLIDIYFIHDSCHVINNVKSCFPLNTIFSKFLRIPLNITGLFIIVILSSNSCQITNDGFQNKV